ncbi:MAG: beta-ketoacyl-[acyl-carrier-protein] synthase II [Pseudomonadales bacterium]|uniref:beta-ketoacyl-ACP synthase II n=1 Tax=unclassified Ketobacter TaxID=2639109 RepID=UPI000C98F3EE|nr:MULTISPECIES: beta-ketoacyl-ACP synthase II [unclassified Ketobacter]MAA61056.1 beta-ketoacyl-[acyl-carrier-protein] synthase II [Pseudomonadales bacterium]MEC8809921.1 beta-ketoacyl-ACP synthase II [Pseudomonadota bacterium]TNC90349.1 MAG: beta-ketoacyl-[acyl-carrier-protein] synthase II [Alcanivorax sp.]HAG92787.1 beta-ketoacyl-[acyl-carrier-protein] synthase II [Gammaproteobacteria bacterium]MAQ26232.1 beta-ketoacyl-[acyl-carrier-protein] synthase II [Pseudomonadales bacterium]
MVSRRVVITGMGAVTPLGNSVEDTWKGLLEGKSGIAPIENYDVSSYSTRFAGQIRNLDVTEYLSSKEARKIDPFIQYGLVASIQAIRDSGLEVTDANRKRIGVAVGSGIGGIGTIERNKELLDKGGIRKVSPFLVPGSIINMISGNLSIMFGLQGPNWAITTACTTATHCIGYASRMIKYGDVDVMIAGGGECGSSPLGMAGFVAARALSTRNDNPQGASRPWDRDRDGFVLSDGAGVLVLEEYEHAKKRGAKIHGELIGFGASSDAHHITAPPENGRGAADAMLNALEDAAIARDSVGYINAHGTSTQAGDIAETNAIKTIFGAHAHKLSVSSTKSMVGHLLGAAGGVEAVFTLLALQNQVAPPTINLDNPDEGCDLDYVPHTAKQREINVALSNSFGFGGTNGTLIFKRA